jgi:RepB DNA-primase from phage plasmid
MSVLDQGLALTLHAVDRQLQAIPWECYEIRLIHQASRKPLPGQRLWSASNLVDLPTLKFLRIRNREGYDVYIRPYARDHNAGYILVDLDDADPGVVASMRSQGHTPCALVETSPGNLQAWIRVSKTPLAPAVATAIGRQLAHAYWGDPASIDWRHLGRLAGFTNQKRKRSQPNGMAPWVKIVYARESLATNASSLLEVAARQPPRPPPNAHKVPLLSADANFGAAGDSASSLLIADVPVTSATARQLYQLWINRLQIPQRFGQPDWSVVDKWIAKELLLRGASPAQVAAVLTWGSPAFPRQHSNANDYLRRTLARAAREL